MADMYIMIYGFVQDLERQVSREVQLKASLSLQLEELTRVCLHVHIWVCAHV